MGIEVQLQVIVAIVCARVFIWGETLYRKMTARKIEELGGRLLTCKRRFGFREFGLAAFSTSVFFFEYIVDEEVKEGWGSFSILFRDDWRL